MTTQLPSRERLEALASGNAFTCVQDDEAAALARFALEHAAEIERLKGQVSHVEVIHVVLPMLVPPAVIQDMKARRVEHALCLKCNEGARGGCSACAYNGR